MKYTISELAKLAGVSVRTLHYYDEIGLLCPAETSESGYRFYGKEELLLLQQILFYRELSFSLSDIAKILQAPHYNRKQALSHQHHLLVLKKERLDSMIELLEREMKGENRMSFEEFSDKKEKALLEEYAKEAKEKYGDTAAYQEYEERAKHHQIADGADLAKRMDEIFKDFALVLDQKPESEAVQCLVKRLQDFITDHYYHCTKEILAGLGQMYVADERFKENIDRQSKGTAEFVSKAIAIYCK